jgi:hypothetical protein
MRATTGVNNSPGFGAPLVLLWPDVTPFGEAQTKLLKTLLDFKNINKSMKCTCYTFSMFVGMHLIKLDFKSKTIAIWFVLSTKF